MRNRGRAPLEEISAKKDINYGFFKYIMNHEIQPKYKDACSVIQQSFLQSFSIHSCNTFHIPLTLQNEQNV